MKKVLIFYNKIYFYLIICNYSEPCKSNEKSLPAKTSLLDLYVEWGSE